MKEGGGSCTSIRILEWGREQKGNKHITGSSMDRLRGKKRGGLGSEKKVGVCFLPAIQPHKIIHQSNRWVGL